MTQQARIEQILGRRARAQPLYERVLGYDPRAGVATNNLAWLYADAGRLQAALELAQTSVAEQPEDPQAHDTLGWVFYQ